jgi:hypothetical protein
MWPSFLVVALIVGDSPRLSGLVGEVAPFIDALSSVTAVAEMELDPKTEDYYRGWKELGYFEPNSLCLLLKEKMDEWREEFRSAELRALGMIELEIAWAGCPPKKEFIRYAFRRGDEVRRLRRALDNAAPDMEKPSADGITILVRLKTIDSENERKNKSSEATYPVRVHLKFIYVVASRGKSEIKVKELAAECRSRGQWKPVP